MGNTCCNSNPFGCLTFDHEERKTSELTNFSINPGGHAIDEKTYRLNLSFEIDLV
jgi:hypothetical protein